MSKKILTIACVLALLLTLAACGRSTNNENTNNGNTNNTPTPNEQNIIAGENPPQNLPTTADAFLVFEGEPIHENDLRFVAGIMGITLETDMEKSHALYQLLEFLTVIHRANTHNLGVTAAEREEMLPTARINVELMGLSNMITDDRLAEFFAIGTLLTRLLDHYVTSYTPDISVYAQEIAAFGEENRNFLADIEIKYIVNQDFALMRDIQGQLLAEGAANFDAIAAEHSVFYGLDGGAITYPLHEFLQVFGLYDHDIAALYTLQAGDVSHVFNIEDFFFVVYVQSRTEASQARIEEAFVQNFNFQHRADLIDGLVDAWIAEANYTLNQDLFAALR